jgi:hypothetical protein
MFLVRDMLACAIIEENLRAAKEILLLRTSEQDGEGASSRSSVIRECFSCVRRK